MTLQDLLNLPPPPKDKLARDMIYFWVTSGQPTGADFYEVMDSKYPDETYWWHISKEAHRAAANAAHDYLARCNQF